MLVEGISFPQTRFERLLDRVWFWITTPYIPISTEPDWDSPLLDVIVTALDE